MSISGELVAIVTIVVVFGGGIALVMLRVVMDYRRKREMFQLHHTERMAAIEKGIEVPALPPEFFSDPRSHSPGRFLHRGLVWTLVGVAITVALWQTESDDFRPLWGLVPTAFGLGTLLFHFIARRSKDLFGSSEDSKPTA
jgi:hypothetical protein